MPTYVLEPATSSSSTRVLHKYMEWGPKSADTDLLDTLYTANLPGTSKVFTGGGNGVIYEATASGQLKSYKDNTATGGSLLTPVKTYAINLSSAKRIMTNGEWIFVVRSDGSMDVYKQSNPATGNGTLTPLASPSVLGPYVDDIAQADDAWMINSRVMWLTNGTIKGALWQPVKNANGTDTKISMVYGVGTYATGVDATQAWSPGWGAISTQSVTSDPDTTGQIRAFTTSPWASADDDIRSGIVGDIMADAGPCLTDPDPEKAPFFGTPPDDTGDALTGEPAADPVAPASRTVTGKFTLGNGQPAPGLVVRLLASDVDIDATDPTKETVVGDATTQADGSWSFTLPDTLPDAVQQAKDANGGILNLDAVTAGTTSGGVKMLGVDPLSAMTDQAAVDASIAGPDNGHSVKLTPNTGDAEGGPKDSFVSSTEPQTYAAKAEANPAVLDGEDPRWQSDTNILSANYNPYIVDGQDVSAEVVQPYSPPPGSGASGNCETVRYPVGSEIRYTVVGEAHAGWDSKAGFEYESSMSTSVETAVKSTGNWSIGASKELSQSVNISVGYANKGSHYAKQYKIPIEYVKTKSQYMCGGNVRSTWYKIEPKRYKAPSGGALGKLGKDVSGKDGSANFNKSPKANRNYVGSGQTFSLAKGKSVKFAAAVSVYGVSLGGKTGYDTNHRQRITAGNKSGKHWIWGKNGSVSSGKAGVFYSK
ncbi:hypothetical protein [Streptomyces sp. BK022]|uniref:hypothetical protein n=1 Tax=Streptomyces sp. BK022 TaxID=2512123 RepID=UPI0010290A54|nr:hypothetical protein [Streptomyces sp. BK022]